MEIKTANSVLLEVATLSEEVRIPLGVHQGTLLGIIREGRLLSHDHDVDFWLGASVPKSAISRLDESLEQNGFRRWETYETPEGQAIAWSFRKTGISVSFIIMHPSRDAVFICKLGTPLGRREPAITLLPAHFLDPPGEIEFLGKKFLIPNPPERYLEELYGDWRVPIIKGYSRNEETVWKISYADQCPESPWEYINRIEHPARVEHLIAKQGGIMNPIHVRDDLLEVKAACDKFDIPCILAKGNLLGVIREKRILPWDGDIDLFTLSSAPYINIIKTMECIESLGFEPWETYMTPEGKVVHWSFAPTRGKTPVGIKMLFPSKDPEFLCETGIALGKRRSTITLLPAHLFDSPKEINFLKHTFLVPNPPEEYLKGNYGDWHTEIKDSSWKKQRTWSIYFAHDCKESPYPDIIRTDAPARVEWIKRKNKQRRTEGLPEIV